MLLRIPQLEEVRLRETHLADGIHDGCHNVPMAAVDCDRGESRPVHIRAVSGGQMVGDGGQVATATRSLARP